MRGLHMAEGIGKDFMKRTQYEYMKPSDQHKGLPQPSIELEYDESKTVFDLPSPREITIKDITLRTAIENRRSIRRYTSQSLTLMELSWLLWCTQGVREILPRPMTLRTVPSAGARHAFETFLLINNVEGIHPGLYRYLAPQHKLLVIDIESQSISEDLTKACLEQKHVKNSAVTFYWVTIVYRMKWRYGERGYRYIHLDAGHVCQNLYLAAENIGCGVCAIAAYEDTKLNDLLGLDGEEQFVVYLATVGKVG
jgi:SagB-type dehydrogenase family enzyme